MAVVDDRFVRYGQSEDLTHPLLSLNPGIHQIKLLLRNCGHIVRTPALPN